MTFASDTMAVEVLADGKYRLTAPLVYHGRDETFIVQQGYCSDFASVPRFLSALVPIAGRYDRAAVLHDMLCVQLKQSVRTKRGAYKRIGKGTLMQIPNAVDVDGIFRRVLRECGTPTVLRWLLYVGVRWGALANPARRAGWAKTAPQVVAISLLALPFVAPVAIVTALALAVGGIAEGIARIIGGERS